MKVDALDFDAGDMEVAAGAIKFHKESVGSQNEFYDDHQQWMIDSFDSI